MTGLSDRARYGKGNLWVKTRPALQDENAADMNNEGGVH
jgi:hypothetical protein